MFSGSISTFHLVLHIEVNATFTFSSVQSLSRVRIFATPWTAAHQASLSITNSWSLLGLMSIELVMPSNHLILCRSLLPPSTLPSIRIFSNELALRIRWPKYWSFSFKISPSNEHPGLISFRMDWLDLLAYFLFSFTYFINKCQMNTFIDFFTITMISHSLRYDAVGARSAFAYQLLAKDPRESDSLPLQASP